MIDHVGRSWVLAIVVFDRRGKAARAAAAQYMIRLLISQIAKNW